jgi:eukaryotic-like serine/threonine-protein kinase
LGCEIILRRVDQRGKALSRGTFVPSPTTPFHIAKSASSSHSTRVMSDHITRLNAALEGRYLLNDVIGVGGMATVYLADDIRHRRSVAVKVLRPELSAVLGGDRFLAEITTTANLQHPHILPLFDSGVADGFLFYVMPFVDGESLRAKLDREKQLPVDEAVRLATAVADALDYAHRHEIIHRDVKPENILLHEGNPVVADFGIALAVSAAAGGRLTETGLSLGTPFYMSPEQATADRDLDARSDVYAVGCVLYEMLAGDPPHTGPTAQSVLMRILTEEPRPVSDVRKSVPPNVAAAVAKSVEKLPADRFESAGAFRDALRDEGFRYIRPNASVDTARPGPDAIPAAPVTWMSQSTSKVAIAVVALLLVLLVWSAKSNPTIGTGPERATVTRIALDLDGLRIPSGVALSPDGAMLVFSSGPLNRPNEQRLYLRYSDGIAIVPIPDTEDGVSPTFSPDGEWIAFALDQNGTIAKVPASGGRRVTLTEQPASVGTMHWGTDQNIYYDNRGGLFRVSADGGSPEHLLPSISRNNVRAPRLLPDERGLLYTEGRPGSQETTVQVLDLETLETKTLLPEVQDARYLASGHLLVSTLDEALFAVPFDAESWTITGSLTPVIDSIGVDDLGNAAFALSKNGTAVYAVGTPRGAPGQILVTVDLDGNEQTLGLPSLRNYSAPRYSPDGSKIAYQSSGELWIYDLIVGNRDAIVSGGGARNPIWSPDGTQIAYVVWGTDSASFETRPTDLSAPSEVILTRDGNRRWATDWTAEGNRLVFNEPDTGRGDVWTVQMDGNHVAGPYLRADGWLEGAATISPSGKWASYESNQDGPLEIFVRSFPTPGERHRVATGVGGRWADGGRKLFFRNGDTVKVATVRSDNDFEVLSIEDVVVGPYRGIEPHPDGQSFIAIKRPPPDSTLVIADESRRLDYVVNWAEELRARLGGG